MWYFFYYFLHTLAHTCFNLSHSVQLLQFTQTHIRITAQEDIFLLNWKGLRGQTTARVPPPHTHTAWGTLMLIWHLPHAGSLGCNTESSTLIHMVYLFNNEPFNVMCEKVTRREEKGLCAVWLMAQGFRPVRRLLDILAAELQWVFRSFRLCECYG